MMDDNSKHTIDFAVAAEDYCTRRIEALRSELSDGPKYTEGGNPCAELLEYQRQHNKLTLSLYAWAFFTSEIEDYSKSVVKENK